jgi:hypothetical protein
VDILGKGLGANLSPFAQGNKKPFNVLLHVVLRNGIIGMGQPHLMAEEMVAQMPKVSNIVQPFQRILPYYVRMKKTRLVPHAILDVPCPTCGVTAGKPCVLWLGDPRMVPHASRKVAAFETVEMTGNFATVAYT